MTEQLVACMKCKKFALLKLMFIEGEKVICSECAESSETAEKIRGWLTPVRDLGHIEFDDGWDD